jgi:hypothetical protein
VDTEISQALSTKIGHMTDVQIKARLAVLRESHWVVATNEGTFGADEAARKVGTGLPEHSVWEVVHYADGRPALNTNPKAHRANVGYPRHFEAAKRAAADARYEFVALERTLARRA